MASKKLKSIFTHRLDVCYLTGSTADVCVHHVFYGNKCRELSEKYGYVVPIIPKMHQLVHDYPNAGYDLALKQHCQKHFEAQGGTRKEFIDLFLKSYL